MDRDRQQGRAVSEGTEVTAVDSASPGKQTLTSGLPAGTAKAGAGDGSVFDRPRAGVPDVLGKIDASAVKSAKSVQSVMAVPDPKNARQMMIVSPGVEMKATVELKDDVDPEPETIQVGWTQTLDSCERIGIYKKDGKVAGADILRFPTSVRDGKSWEGIPAPWYGMPGELGKDIRVTHVTAEDQPSVHLPIELQGARLAEVKGKDSFTSTVKAGPSASSLIALKSFKWEAPWSITIDPGKVTKGGDLTIPKEARDAKPAIDDREARDVGNDPKSHSGLELFPDVSAAAQRMQLVGIHRFLAELPRHQQISQESYWNAVGALWKSSARFEVEVVPRAGRGPDGESLGGARTMTVGFAGDKTVTLPERQGSGVFSALAHMVYDPAALGPGKYVTIMINGVSAASISFPFGNEVVSEDHLEQEAGLFGPTYYKYSLRVRLKG